MPIALNFLIQFLAIGYLVHAVIDSDGPFGCFAWARANLPFAFDTLFECPICLSPWLSALVMLVFWYQPLIVYPVALAGLYLLAVYLWQMALNPPLSTRQRIINAKDLHNMLVTEEILDYKIANAVVERYLRRDGDLDIAYLLAEVHLELDNDAK